MIFFCIWEESLSLQMLSTLSGCKNWSLSSLQLVFVPSCSVMIILCFHQNNVFRFSLPGAHFYISEHSSGFSPISLHLSGGTQTGNTAARRPGQCNWVGRINLCLTNYLIIPLYYSVCFYFLIFFCHQPDPVTHTVALQTWCFSYLD